jgi:hypothetical protein
LVVRGEKLDSPESTGSDTSTDPRDQGGIKRGFRSVKERVAIRHAVDRARFKLRRKVQWNQKTESPLCPFRLDVGSKPFQNGDHGAPVANHVGKLQERRETSTGRPESSNESTN